MRIGILASSAVATIDYPNDPNGWWLWHYRSIADDINGDGKEEIVLIANTMLEGYMAQTPVANSRTYLTILTVESGRATDVTSLYLPNQFIEGWSRRTYLEDLNKDGIKDFIFVMNQEDGRDNSNMGKGTSDSFWMGSNNKILVSDGNKFTEKNFGDVAWHHLGAIGDYDANGQFDFVDGYFMDKDGYGKILLWEFDPIQNNFVLKRDISNIGISASSGLIINEQLIASKDYPNNGSIVIIDLKSGEKREIFSRQGVAADETLVFWNGNVSNSLVKTLPDGSKISENGSGEVKMLAETNTDRIAVLTEDISDLVSSNGGQTWNTVSRQDLHLIDLNNHKLLQTVNYYTKNDINYQNTFNVVDVNNDGFNDVAYDKNVLWNVSNKFLFKSDYGFWSLFDDTDMVNIYSGRNSGENFEISSVNRINDDLVFTSITTTVYTSADGSPSPNFAISAFGLDNVSSGYGIINSVHSDFSLFNVISHEAGKHNISANRILETGNKNLLVSNDSLLYAISPDSDGSLGFAFYKHLTSGTQNNDLFQFKSGELFDGLDGIDNLKVGSRLGEFQLSFNDASFIFIGNKIQENGCEATNIERLNFSDVSLALDTGKGEIAGSAYRLYKAAFDRLPEAEGLGFWINTLDQGANLVNVAQGFINSNEFRVMYGANPSDQQFVTLLYNHVLHRPPEGEGYQFWLNSLGAGVSRAQVLKDFSESTENINQTAELIANGIQYEPWIG